LRATWDYASKKKSELTPLDIANNKDNDKLVNLLRSHGGKTGGELRKEQEQEKK
jgi:hypothetical protein